MIREKWESAYIGSDRIGYFHTVTVRRPAGGNGSPHPPARQAHHQRFGQKMSMETISDFFELADGRLYSISLAKPNRQRSDQKPRDAGRSGESFESPSTVRETSSKRTLDWPPAFWGLMLRINRFKSRSSPLEKRERLRPSSQNSMLSRPEHCRPRQKPRPPSLTARRQTSWKCERPPTCPHRIQPLAR